MLAFNGSVGTYQIVGLIVAVLLPILVDLVTQRLAHPGVKAITLAALAAINGVLVEFIQATDAGVDFILEQAVLNALTGFIIATAMFYGLWNPTKVSGAKGAIQTRLPGGIGKTSRDQIEERGAAYVSTGGAIALILVGLLIVFLTTIDILGWILVVAGALLLLLPVFNNRRV